MKIKTKFWSAAVGSLPLMLGVYLPDSTVHSLKVAGGTGQYATIFRDCAGNPTSSHGIPYKDVGGEYSFSPPGAASLGLRASRVWDRTVTGSFPDTFLLRRERTIINPFFQLDWRKFGIGGGVAFNGRQNKVTGEKSAMPSWYLRIARGPIYFSSTFFSGVPLYSGGGGLNMGIGGAARDFGWWAGWSAGFQDEETGLLLYDGNGFLGRADIRIAPGWLVNVTGRAGASSGTFEGGVSLGLTKRWALPVQK